MRSATIIMLFAIGCGDSPSEAKSAHVLDGATDVSLRCSPAEYDAGLDAALPTWAMGFFFADPPTGGSDAFDLRLGPGPEFELAVTGCDVFGTRVGEHESTTPESGCFLRQVSRHCAGLPISRSESEYLTSCWLRDWTAEW
jgi:hypothetical protein